MSTSIISLLHECVAAKVDEEMYILYTVFASIMRELSRLVDAGNLRKLSDPRSATLPVYRSSSPVLDGDLQASQTAQASI
jgi:hypothetical protein